MQPASSQEHRDSKATHHVLTRTQDIRDDTQDCISSSCSKWFLCLIVINSEFAKVLISVIKVLNIWNMGHLNLLPCH